MKRILIILAVAAALVPLAAGVVSAQNSIETVLCAIEHNNSTLKALREQSDAEKLVNRTGLFLENPEVEFNYLWGKPSAMGNRKDFKVSQTFDFPSAYARRSQLARIRNEQVEVQYHTERMSILLEAKLYCVDLVYCNAMRHELETRLENAEAIAAVSASRLASGDGTSLDNNKAQLDLIMTRNEYARNEVERQAVLAELTRLNGGEEVRFDDTDYMISLPSSFDSWAGVAAERSPLLQYVRGEVEAGQKQVQLSRAMSLPKLSAGYMSEKVVGEQVQGVSLSMSIPLWENRNSVRSAKAMVRAAEAREQDARVQFYSQLRNQYNRATALQRSADDYQTALNAYSSTGLLRKALEAGELSILTYLTELEQYYIVVDNVLSVRRDYQRACVELSAVEL